jgi:hypothetical protein
LNEFTFIGATAECSLALYDARRGTKMQEWRVGSSAATIRSVACDPDGRHVAVALSTGA